MKKITIVRVTLLAACTSIGLWGMTANATDMGWNGKTEGATLLGTSLPALAARRQPLRNRKSVMTLMILQVVFPDPSFCP